jgi:anti-sigma regulatory factor (Ser/Thr protein kinase)
MADTGRLLQAQPGSATAFKAKETAVSAARAYIEEALEACELTHLMDDAKLIVSELVTNAIRYTTDVVVVQWSVSEDAEFVIEVGDSAPELPEIATDDALSLHGRGLVIVAAVADDWGAHRIEGGKITWATLKIQSA